MFKLKKNKLFHKRIFRKHLFHESLFSFVFPSVWLEKKHNNKVLTKLCKGKVCWFSRDLDTCSMAKLLKQHFRRLLARGYCGRIPSPLSAPTTKKTMKA